MKTFIAANWKMNKNTAEAKDTARQLMQLLHGTPIACEVIIFAPFLSIAPTYQGLGNASPILVGAQNFYPEHSGAFTGEISLNMLRDIGCSWVLIGHSERRHIFGESNDLIAKKTHFALQEQFSIILCVGETEEERKAGALKEVLFSQINTALANIPPHKSSRILVAYEPVWAIGTGNVASEHDIIEAHTVVKKALHTAIGALSINIPILYGGSVTPENAQNILLLDNVNGLLVGGASLHVEKFNSIIRAGLNHN